MKSFKFLSQVKTSRRSRRDIRPSGYRPIYNSFSYPDNVTHDGEMNYMFIWSINDRRSNEYRSQIFQGAIKHFGRTYDDLIIEDDEILFMFPTIESISIMSDYTNIPVGENHQFTDPNEIVTIFYKIYTNE